MFFRTKTSGPRSYLQIVENRWEDGRPRQRVLATLGRLDQLQQSGQLDALLASGARLAQSVLLLSAYARQFLEQMEKPDVDVIEGLSPAISIEQKQVSKNPRSTVGTVTEIYDYLRLLFAS